MMRLVSRTKKRISRIDPDKVREKHRRYRALRDADPVRREAYLTISRARNERVRLCRDTSTRTEGIGETHGRNSSE